MIFKLKLGSVVEVINIRTHSLPMFMRLDSVYQKNYFSYFSTKTFVVGTQKNRLNETVLLSTQNICKSDG